MQVDALALALRPRTMPEAADLGVRLVQSRARSVWFTFTPVFLAVLAIALPTIEIAVWLPGLIIFWLKPWLDRTLLFVLSRAVFGEDTTFADLWRERSQVWWRQLLHTLTLRRLSPWRSFTQAAYQLEGQRGSAMRARRKQLLRGKRGSAGGMHFVFANLEAITIAGLFGLAMWFSLPGKGDNMFSMLFRDESVGAGLIGAVTYAAVVLALEPFYVAAGFAMYLNRRVELEAWDIEQEFRRAFV